jgi:hypothetical protein
MVYQRGLFLGVEVSRGQALAQGTLAGLADCAGRAHALEGPDFVQKLHHELRAGLHRGVFRIREIQPQGEDAARIEPGLHVTEAPEAPASPEARPFGGRPGAAPPPDCRTFVLDDSRRRCRRGHS